MKGLGSPPPWESDDCKPSDLETQHSPHLESTRRVSNTREEKMTGTLKSITTKPQNTKEK